MKITSIFSRVKHYPIFFGLPLLVGVLFLFWWLQQNNVNLLSQSINDLQQQIEKMPSSDLKSSLGKDLVGLRKDQVVLQNKVYETLVQGLGGAFFFVTAYLTWRNIKASEEKQITERFSQAVGFLGKPELEVRLGGIYALERISRDSKKDYWQIIEILTAYVRTKAPVQSNNNHLNDEGNKKYDIPIDIQAVLTILKRRNPDKTHIESNYIDLRKTNLNYAYLKEANLDRANFSNACLKKINLHRASLQYARFWNADLTEADLKFAILNDAELGRATLREAYLWEAKLQRAELISADFQKAKLGCALLQGANLKHANLRQAKLKGAQLQSIKLNGKKVKQTNLEDADLQESDFSGADLTNANLARANLAGASFERADLSKANFSGAILDNTNFSGAILTGANLSNVKIDKIIGLTRSQIQQARQVDVTSLPDYLK
ncbi:MAG: pentapeptide repeat-containing protein [Leptolyngbyaceae cyanobacterium SM1_4_3]|nr:pentapeptide repeat-containing protein [Leptolyngbyaceae cyanobacterium SM1_4_3]